MGKGERIQYRGMENLGSKDYVSLDLSGNLGSYSFETLGRLYLPLIGSTAIGVYQGLFALAGMSTFLSMEDLVRFLGVSYQGFEDASKGLEALGLLQSFVREDASKKVYSLYLYPPLSPKAFLNNYLLCSTLKENVGEQTFSKITRDYVQKNPPVGAQEVSTSFGEYFRSKNAGKSIREFVFAASEDSARALQLGFDHSLFEETLVSRGVSPKLFSPEEMSFLEEASVFYAYPADVIASYAATSIVRSEPFGKKLSRSSFLKKCQEDMKLTYLRESATESALPKEKDELAKKIQLLDSIAPAKFLWFKQGGKPAAKSDLKLIEHLHFDLGLPNPCVNALVDYVLEANDNVLSSALCEKLAAMLVRKHVTNARDAMEALRDTRSYKKKSKTSSPTSMPTSMEQNTQESEETKEISDEELDAMFDAIYAGRAK